MYLLYVIYISTLKIFSLDLLILCVSILPAYMSLNHALLSAHKSQKGHQIP